MFGGGGAGFVPVFFFKLFLRTVFENTSLVFYEICFYSLNLVSFFFFVFFRSKKK